MSNLSESQYTQAVKEHYTIYWGKSCSEHMLTTGPVQDMGPNFKVLEFPPSKNQPYWCYATIGMSKVNDVQKLELYMLSNKKDKGIVELLTVTAHFHLTGVILAQDHTVNLGKPWQDNSVCEYALVSPPYTEPFEFGKMVSAVGETRFCWLLPISEAERKFKTEHGVEKLEELFEEEALNFWDPDRVSLV